MKKKLSVLLAILMLLSVFALAGCGGSDEPADATDAAANEAATNDETQDALQPEDASDAGTDEEETTKAGIPDEPVVPDTLEVVKEIFDYNENSHWIDYLIVLKNVSEETVAVECAAVARDAEGNFISGDNNKKIADLGPGQTSFVTLQFLKNPPEDAKVSYVLTTTPVKHYRDVLANLDVESEVSLNDSGKKQVTVTVTNNGTDEAQSVDALALCYDADGNYATFVEITYIQTESYRIPAGASGTKTESRPGLDADIDYETVEVYLRAQSQYIF